MTLNDGFFQIGLTEHKEFYNVDKADFDVEEDISNLFYARFTLRMESREDTYERTVFSVFDFTGLIGGVFEIFEVIGGIIVGYFARKIILFSMISNLYQVQRDFNTRDQEFNKVIPTTRRVVNKRTNWKKDIQITEEIKIPVDQTKSNKDGYMDVVKSLEK